MVNKHGVIHVKYCRGSFLMGERGRWSLSPAYDLTFSVGPAGEHSTTVMGECKNPQLKHLMKLAEVSSVPLIEATK